MNTFIIAALVCSLCMAAVNAQLPELMMMQMLAGGNNNRGSGSNGGLASILGGTSGSSTGSSSSSSTSSLLGNLPRGGGMLNMPGMGRLGSAVAIGAGTGADMGSMLEYYQCGLMRVPMAMCLMMMAQ
ncbi:hypothetical protein ACF0H5_019217 [Mactra antiquata]